MAEATSIHQEHSDEAYLAWAKKQLEQIPHSMPDSHDIPVVWKYGDGWYWGFKQGPHGTITGDEKDLEEKGYEYCEGVITHEGLHPEIDFVDQFSSEEWNQPGFAVGYNWFADNRIEYAADNFVYQGRKKIAQHLSVDVQPGEGLDISLGKKTSGVGSVIQKKLGYIPKDMLLGGVARNYFYEKEIAKTLQTQQDFDAFVAKVHDINPEVADAFVRIAPDLERHYKTIPERFSTEQERKRVSYQAGGVYRGRLYPEYQKLVEESYEDHTMAKFASDLAGGAQFQGQQGGQVIVIDFDSLPEDVKKEIAEKIKEAQKQSGQQGQEQSGQQQGGKQQGKQSGQQESGGQQGEQEGQQQVGGQQSGQQLGGEQGGQQQSGGGQSGEQQAGGQQSGQQGGQSGQEQSGQQSGGGQSGQQSGGEQGSLSGEQNGQQSGGGQSGQQTEGKQAGKGQNGSSMQTGEQGTQEAESGESEEPKIPWDQLSDHAKEEIKKKFGQVDENQQQAVKEKAAEEMGETEDEVNQTLQGHTDKEGASKETNVGEQAKQQAKEGSPQSSKSSSSLQQPEQSQDKQSESDEGQPSEQQQNISPTTDESQAGESNQPPQDTQQSGQENKKPKKQTTPFLPSAADVKAFEKFKKEQDKKYGPETQYDAVLQTSVAKNAVKYLKSENSFDPNSQPRVQYYSSGEDFDAERDMNQKMAGLVPREAFFEEGQKEELLYHFLLLLDLSGSMDDKLEDSFAFSVIQTEYLSGEGISNAVAGFTTGWADGGGGIGRLFKSFDDTQGYGATVPKEIREKLGWIVSSPYGGGPIGGGGTPTSAALDSSFDHILLPEHQKSEDPSKDRYFLILITDGEPTDSYKNMSPEQTVVWMQKELKKKAQAPDINMNLSILCFGIGPGTEFVKNIFPALPTDLQAELARVISHYRADKGLPPIKPKEVTTSFMDVEELVMCYPTILRYIIDNPEDFG